MRKVTALVVTTFLFLDVCAQHEIDSLRGLLTSAKQDTTRINLLNAIGATYAESKPDSTFKYSTYALVLSRKSNYKKGEITALLHLAGPSAFAGDFPGALEYVLGALKKSE